MTRLDSFKKWFEENGAAPRDCELIDDAGDKNGVGNEHGCYGFYCPENVPLISLEDGGRTAVCEKCPYNEFWFKEV